LNGRRLCARCIASDHEAARSSHPKLAEPEPFHLLAQDDVADDRLGYGHDAVSHILGLDGSDVLLVNARELASGVVLL
jgi:hypothetical protein